MDSEFELLLIRSVCLILSLEFNRCRGVEPDFLLSPQLIAKLYNPQCCFENSVTSCICGAVVVVVVAAA